jgi:hypothetical protein
MTPAPHGPSRDDSVTTCPTCHQALGVVVGRQRYCSAACRQRAYRSRHPHHGNGAARVVSGAVIDATKATAATVVSQCPECDERSLGVQRCTDCNTFTTRIGAGGTCPCCDEIITLDELTLAMAS